MTTAKAIIINKEIFSHILYYTMMVMIYWEKIEKLKHTHSTQELFHIEFIMKIIHDCNFYI